MRQHRVTRQPGAARQCAREIWARWAERQQASSDVQIQLRADSALETQASCQIYRLEITLWWVGLRRDRELDISNKIISCNAKLSIGSTKFINI